MTLQLGAIADDFTGATDLALLIRKAGYSVVQTIGVPGAGVTLPRTDAVVIALKSRTCPVEQAVSRSLEAYRFLESRGMQQCFFKYCSTFDSTPKGNIGPVADALLEASGAGMAVACPSFPENGRTVYRGHLFVNQQLLSESPLRNHPLTPMTDANLVRVLAPQTCHPVGLIDVDEVERGAGHLGGAMSRCATNGQRLIIVDATNDSHLDTLGEAIVAHRLVTGGSALGASLAKARLNADGKGRQAAKREMLRMPAGGSVILAGSCSDATLVQIRYASESLASLKLDIDAIATGQFDVKQTLDWVNKRLPAGPVMIYTSEPATAREARAHGLSPEALGERIEESLAVLVSRLVESGVRRLVVAGGETSGAVVSSLGVDYLHIGEQIDPGVPWTVTNGGPNGQQPVALALKSGNFGAEDFFIRALDRLADN